MANTSTAADAASAASPAQAASKAIADANAEAEKLQLDEAGPDHYFLVNGQKVLADGTPYKAKAKD